MRWEYMPAKSVNRLVFCLALTIGIAALTPTGAQTVAHKETALRLAKKVHLLLGAVSLPAVLKALSDQTGVSIAASDYLSERRLIVQMDNITAADALNALAELNDWMWYEIDPNKILMTRRLLRMPSIPAAIPRKIQSALPKDMRTFCHIPTPDEDLTHYVDPDRNGFSQVVEANTNRPLWSHALAARQRIFELLKPGILTGKPVLFTKMSLQQQNDLAASLLFDTLRKTSSRLLHGDLTPGLFDPSHLTLQMSGGSTLLVTTPVGDGATHTGFGAQIAH